MAGRARFTWLHHLSRNWFGNFWLYQKHTPIGTRLRLLSISMLTFFTKKYGQPSNQYFWFREPYKEGDGHEMLALKLDKLVCLYSWEIPGGSILLEIDSVVYEEARITISYEDEEVTKIARDEKSDIDNNTF